MVRIIIIEGTDYYKIWAFLSYDAWQTDFRMRDIYFFMPITMALSVLWMSAPKASTTAPENAS